MSSNSALIAQAEKIASSKGLKIETDGLTNVELKTLVTKLRGSTTQQPGEQKEEAAITENTQGKEANQTVEPVPPTLTDSLPQPVTANGGVYVVAQGKSITCKRGILEEGETVELKYIGGGVEALEKLVERGYLIKT